MHDLVRDLAQWASKETCFHLEDMSSANKQLVSSKKARHLSYGQGYLDGECKFEVLSKVERVEQRLRTFLPLAIKREQCYVSPIVISNWLPKFKRLRVLSLEGYQITELPESIGDLRHLRHLNLSGTRIKRLLESKSSLINLLILKLKNCCHLRKLPFKMRNLTKLRYLDIGGVPLDEMPLGIDKLKDLQYLSDFSVGKGGGVALKELKDLKFLRGKLCISGLMNAVDLYEKSEMILNDKQKLRVLELKWNYGICNVEKEKKLLNLLQPHRDLEGLTIKSYGGIEFPSWVGCPSSFSKLTVLTLENCMYCTILPSLGLLRSLKDLTIRWMPRLKRIGNEFCGQHCSMPFQSLETLCFENLLEWEYWEPIKENENGGAFPLLGEFTIQDCHKLHGSLPSCLRSVEKFVIRRCYQLVVSFSSTLPKFCSLYIDKCREMTCVDPFNFKSLMFVTLSNIVEFGNGSKQDYFQKTNLVSFPVAFYFSNLCKLEITCCHTLTSLPTEMNYRNKCLESLKLTHCDSLKFIINGPLPSSLKRLEIGRCDKLEYLWDDREISCTSVVDKEHTFVLEFLHVYYCRSLTNLSLSGRLPSTLSTLHLNRLWKLESIAESFHDNVSLEEIGIEFCVELKNISLGLHNCSSLQKIEISNCGSIVKLAEEGLPKDNLSKLYISDCVKLEGLPKGFHSLDSLKELRLSECPSMRSFPEEGFPTKLTSLEIDGEVNIYKPLLEWGLHNLTILKALRLYGHEVAESSSFQKTKKRRVESLSFQEQEMGMRLPPSLTDLSIHYFPNLKWVLSHDFQNLNSLERLKISDCPDLTSFPKVALPSSLQSLDIMDCPSLTSISELILPSSLQSLEIMGCPGLTFISKLGLPSSLQYLNIMGCLSLTSISELATAFALKSLDISYCSDLTSVSGSALPSSLQYLSINGCPNLTSISKSGLPSSLLHLIIYDCSNLRSLLTEQRLPSSLLELDIWDCAMLKEECRRDKGKVWPNISHIPKVKIHCKSMDELEDGESMDVLEDEE